MADFKMHPKFGNGLAEVGGTVLGAGFSLPTRLGLYFRSNLLEKVSS
jgi:hypothetical protein